MRLPPRGSAQDLILEEVHRRDRAERFQLATLLVRVLGQGLGVHDGFVSAMLDRYGDELTQLTYHPAYRTQQRQKLKQAVAKRTKKKLDDEALLKRLDKFTVTDDEFAPKKTKSNRSR